METISIIISVLFVISFLLTYFHFPRAVFLVNFSILLVLGMIIGQELGGVMVIFSLTFLALWFSMGTRLTLFGYPVMRTTQFFFIEGIVVAAVVPLLGFPVVYSIFSGLVTAKLLIIVLLSAGKSWKTIPLRVALLLGIVTDILFYFTEYDDETIHLLNMTEFLIAIITPLIAIYIRLKTPKNTEKRDTESR